MKDYTRGWEGIKGSWKKQRILKIILEAGKKRIRMVETWKG